MNPQFKYWSTNEKRVVIIVKPRDTIMGTWILCSDLDGGRQSYIPADELEAYSNQDAPDNGSSLNWENDLYSQSGEASQDFPNYP